MSANARPLMERAASEAAQGVQGIDPLTILAALQVLIPLLRACAGDDPAGWLAGNRPRLLPRREAGELREQIVRNHLAHEGVRGAVADRLVERLRAAKPLEVVQMYAEAGRR